MTVKRAWQMLHTERQITAKLHGPNVIVAQIGTNRCPFVAEATLNGWHRTTEIGQAEWSDVPDIFKRVWIDVKWAVTTNYSSFTRARSTTSYDLKIVENWFLSLKSAPHQQFYDDSATCQAAAVTSSRKLGKHMHEVECHMYSELQGRVIQWLICLSQKV